MKQDTHEKMQRWGIRKLSIGVASVAIASFFVTGGAVVAAETEVQPPMMAAASETAMSDNHASETATPAMNNSDANTGMNEAMQPSANEATPMDSATTPAMDTANKMENHANPSDSSTSTRNMSTEVATTTPATSESTEAANAMTTSTSMTATATDASVKESVKKLHDSIDVPVEYLEGATQAAPFTAGVNGVIPYEAFGGDGMLTRLLLKESDTAKWSNNGADKNPALLPTQGLGDKNYFYEVDLNGNTTGVSGDDLLALLKNNGTKDYAATVKVYGSKMEQDMRVADLMNVVATRSVAIHLNGRTSVEDVKKTSETIFNAETKVPYSYVEAAAYPGPFTAGVNQVIPYEAFGGDGMLTRLILNAAMGAKWSDNGKDHNAPILPFETLAHKQYVYEVDLDGVATGKMGQELIDTLKANGAHTYNATIKIYQKDKTTTPIVEKMVAVTITKDGKVQMANSSMSTDSMTSAQTMTMPQTSNKDEMHLSMKDDNAAAPMMKDEVIKMADESSQMMKDEAMPMSDASSKMAMTATTMVDNHEKSDMMKVASNTSKMAAAQTSSMMVSTSMKELPMTGTKASSTVAFGLFSLLGAFLVGGVRKKKEID